MDFIHQVEPLVPKSAATAAAEYLRSGGWLTEFQKTRELEQMIASYVGADHGIVVTSGTVALYLALLAAGVGPGDKVIVPNFTMIASVNAVAWTGAEAVLADVEPDTFCLDLNTVRLDPACKALMYVSINGRHGDMDNLTAFCRDNGLALIEDSAQSLGARVGDRFLGTFGDAGVYSFTPHKIITTGQGGIVVTNNDELAAKVRKLKDFHRQGPASDWHDGLGYNFKFTDIQAVIGIEQMREIDSRVARKKATFARYQERLAGLPGASFLPTDLGETPPWFIDLFVADREIRDGLMAYLKENHVGSRPLYPPINHQPMYEQAFPKGSMPVSEEAAHKGIWLPSSLGLTDEQIDRVCTLVTGYLQGR